MAKTRPSDEQLRSMVAKLSDADRNRLMWWRIAHAGTRPRQAANWITSLREIIESLSSAPTSAMASLFWLRLKSTLDELRHGHAPQPPELPPDPDDLHEMNDYLLNEYYADLAADVYSACDALLNSFTPDELLYIEWRRDSEAHVWVDSYDLAPKGNGKLKESRQYSLLGEVRTHDELKAAIARVSRRRSYVDVAVEFAGRANPHVDAIMVALERLNSI